RALAVKENVWYESPRFYLANVGDPSTGKSPAMEAVLKSYHALQARMINEYRQAQRAYEQALAHHELVLRANRSLPADQRRPLPDVPDQPPLPERFVVMNATVESLAPILEANPRGLLMSQDEALSWVLGMDQYRNGKGND